MCVGWRPKTEHTSEGPCPMGNCAGCQAAIIAAAAVMWLQEGAAPARGLVENVHARVGAPVPVLRTAPDSVRCLHSLATFNFQ
jgi:hypothetical protein